MSLYGLPLSLRLYYTCLYRVCSFDKRRHIFLVQTVQVVFSNAYKLHSNILNCFSGRIFKFCLQPEGYVGTCCATHRLARAVLLEF